MKLDLDDLNYLEWSEEFVVFAKTQGIQNQLIFSSFDRYFLSLPKSELEKEYDSEIVDANRDEEKIKAVKESWKRERRRFISDKDILIKKWKEDDETTKGYIEKYINKSLKLEIRELETAYEMWERLKVLGKKNQGVQEFYLFSIFLNLSFSEKMLLSEFLNQHQEIYLKLLGTKCEQTQFCVCMKLLNCLPSEHKSLVKSIIQEKEINLSILKEKFMIEDNRKKTEMLKEEEMLKGEEANNTSAKKKCSRCKVNELSPNAPPKATLCFKCFSDDNKRKYNQKKQQKEEANNTTQREKERKEKEKQRDKSISKKSRNKRESSDDSDAYSCLVETKEKEEKVIVNSSEAKSNNNNNIFYLDSACTAHLTNQREIIQNAKKTETRISGPLSNANSSQATIRGEVNLKIMNEREEINNFKLTNVIYDKNMRRNLMSVPCLLNNNNDESELSAIFTKDKCYVINGEPIFKKEDVVLFGKLDESKLYAIQNDMSEGNIFSNQTTTSLSNNRPLTLKELHLRLGHIPHAKILEMVKLKQLREDQVKREKDDMKSECETCAIAKLPRSDFAIQKSTQAADVGEAIHSDLCGPLPSSVGNNNYFVTYIDEKSDYIFIKCIKKKSDNFEVLKSVREKIKTQTGKRMKKLVSDGGGEYIGNEVKEYLEMKGIIQQLTPPDTPQLNGKSERLNRTLMNFVRAMLKERNLPQSFWGECLRYAVYLRNRMSKRGEKKSRFEVFHKRKPAPLRAQIFGCMVYYKNNSKKKKILDDRARLGIFVGVNEEEGTYRIYDTEKKVVVKSRDVMFFEGTKLPESIFAEEEKELIYLNEDVTEMRRPEKKRREDEDEESEEEIELPQAQPLLPVPEARRARRERQERREQAQEGRGVAPNLGRSRYPNRRANNVNNNQNNYNNINNNNNNNPESNDDQESEEEIQDIFSYIAEISKPQSARRDPKYYYEAMKREDNAEWKEAMKAEKRSMEEMCTFEEVKEIPGGRTVIDSQWVFTTKYDEKGVEIRKKARLVARGDRQKEGIDYNETFAPVVKYNSLRYIINYAFANNIPLHQLDVETAYLNGDLKEEIYMRLPIGYDEKERKIVRLIKSLYGLRQSPRCWNEKFVRAMKEMEFMQSQADPCVFIRDEKNGERSIITVFVDDLIIASKNYKEVKEMLMKKFKMRDLGELKWILGMRVERSDEKIEISQEAYVNEILDKFDMSDSKPAPTPLPQKVEELSMMSEESKKIYPNKKRYQSILGALLYLSNTTRPDITYSVNFLARKMSNPSELDYSFAKRVLRYLNGTRKMKLRYDQKGEMLVGFSDASYAEDKKDRKSTSGYTFISNGGAISWKSNKQPTVTLSSCEAEYVALANAAKEAMWLKSLCREVDKKGRNEPIIIFEDNQSTIMFANNPIQSERTKHIEIKYHYIRERVAEGKIEVKICADSRSSCRYFY